MPHCATTTTFSATASARDGGNTSQGSSQRRSSQVHLVVLQPIGSTADQHQPSSSPLCGLSHVVQVAVLVLLANSISIALTLFMKWFLGVFPFATTATWFNLLQPYLLSLLLAKCTTTRTRTNKASRLPRAMYWRLAVPIGLFNALDITLGNLALMSITVTFYTIVKSASNVWNLAFSIALGHQRASKSLFAVVLLIASGIALAGYGSTDFVLRGFLLALAASLLGTLRWVLTQSLFQQMEAMDGAPPCGNPTLAVMLYTSPASVLGLLPIALITESSDLVHSKFVHDSSLLLQSILLILVSGFVAFVLLYVKVLLVKKTSALTLGVAGSFRDVTQVLCAVGIFGDHLSVTNVCGVVAATIGMLLYTLLQHFAPPKNTPTPIRSTSSSSLTNVCGRSHRHHTSIQVESDLPPTSSSTPVAVTDYISVHCEGGLGHTTRPATKTC